MPIYEYACPACGHSFEKIQRTDLHQAPCPVCGKLANRIVSRPASTAASNGPSANSGCGNGGFT